MGKHVAPEKFVVGETVEFYQGEYRSTVTVFAVNGDEVTAGSHPEIADVFVPRPDGKHVVKGTPDFAHMPTMIFHTPEPAPTPKRVTLWQRLNTFLDSTVSDTSTPGAEPHSHKSWTPLGF